MSLSCILIICSALCLFNKPQPFDQGKIYVEILFIYYVEIYFWKKILNNFVRISVTKTDIIYLILPKKEK